MVGEKTFSHVWVVSSVRKCIRCVSYLPKQCNGAIVFQLRKKEKQQPSISTNLGYVTDPFAFVIFNPYHTISSTRPIDFSIRMQHPKNNTSRVTKAERTRLRTQGEGEKKEKRKKEERRISTKISECFDNLV